MALTDKLTAIADAIRGKTGGTEAMTLDQMPGEIEGITTGGGVNVFAGYFNATIEQYDDSEVLKVPNYAFEWNAAVKSVDFPNAASVGTNAFWHAYNLTSVNMQSVKTIGAGAFCATQIANADFPLATSVGKTAFQSCLKLNSVNIPKAASLEASAFNSCTSLEMLDLASVATALPDQVFRRCTALTTIILRSATVVPMQYESAFKETPFASDGTGGTVYVPSALIPEYQAATNWSALYEAGTCNFVAIEGSEYE